MSVVFDPFTGQIIDTGSSSGGGGGGSSFIVDLFTLDSTDISNKFIILSSTPQDSSKVLLSVITGIDQDNGTDYSVTGTTLSWNALGLDSLLEAGMKLVVTYSTI